MNLVKAYALILDLPLYPLTWLGFTIKCMHWSTGESCNSEWKGSIFLFPCQCLPRALMFLVLYLHQKVVNLRDNENCFARAKQHISKKPNHQFFSNYCTVAVNKQKSLIHQKPRHVVFWYTCSVLKTKIQSRTGCMFTTYNLTSIQVANSRNRMTWVIYVPNHR